jgi:phosphoribosylformylglycinamidine (FGAM) synthase PurS component
MGLPEGSGLFSELYMNMLEEIKKNKNKAKDYGDAINMSEYEKKISFLNRYFVYKKIRNVNTEKVQMEFGDYNYSEIERNNQETNEAVVLSKELEKENENKKKRKVRKLARKLILNPSTEALE